MSEKNGDLKRSLKARHLNMIALGGAIGTGIFLAMGDTIQQVGPGGAFLAYALIGVMVYFIMTSLGELATFIPISGSFGTYATKFIDPALGFALGWNYWYNWAVTIATEMVAGSLVMHFWFPNVKPVYWSMLFLGIIVLLNIVSARAYGEAEFWFSLVKVVTVIIFLAVGVLTILGIFDGNFIGLKNFTADGGPFIGNGFSFFSVFLVAGFAFQGTELVGVAAGESDNPGKTIPKAINQVFWRILIFYLGTILVIGAIIPAAQAGVSTSVFTLVFEKAGLAAAAAVMNAVILTAVLSAGNSGMYASSRMLYSMAKEGMAPKVFGKVTKRGVPLNAIILTTIVASLCFLTGVFAQNTVYIWLVDASGLAGFIAWLGISLCHYRFRKAYVAQGYDVKKLKYRAKLFPIGPIIALTMCGLIVIFQGFGDSTWQTLVAAYIGIPLFLAFYIGYKIKYKTKILKLHEVDLAFSETNPDISAYKKDS